MRHCDLHFNFKYYYMVVRLKPNGGTQKILYLRKVINQYGLRALTTVIPSISILRPWC
jgi:hypothetical protein